MSNTPKVRFKGFGEEWEWRRLSAYLTVSTLKNRDKVYGKEDVLSVSGDYGIVNQIEFQGRSFAGESVINLIHMELSKQIKEMQELYLLYTLFISLLH